MPTKYTKEEREALRDEVFDYLMDCMIYRIIPFGVIVGFGVLIGRIIS